MKAETNAFIFNILHAFVPADPDIHHTIIKPDEFIIHGNLHRVFLNIN